MKAYFKKILSLVTAGIITASALPFVSAQAKDVSSMTAVEIAKDMGLGWNLGNTLEAHDGTNHKKMGLESETFWGNPKASKALFDAVKAKGFRTIRIPVTWYPHADANYNIDTAWMNRVKQVVDWAVDENTYVILNIHHEEWNTPTNANYAAASKELKAFWKQIATEFRDYDRHLIFEGMNEPRNYGGAHEWDGGTDDMRKVINKLDKDFVDTVRSTGGKNKTRCLMIPTYAASSTTVAMRALSIPDDPNVMVSIHAYSPYNFTMNTGSGATSVFGSAQENELKQLFNNINSIFLSNGKAVVIGEFSSSNKNNTDERVKWAKSYATLAKQKGIPIVLWDNNSPKDNYNNGEGHGYINRKTLAWYSTAEPVVDSLVKNYYGSSVSKTDLSKCKAVLSQTKYFYDGTQHKPSVTVTYNGKTLTNGTDYTAAYSGGKAIGTGTVTLTGKGSYTGTVKLTFTVAEKTIGDCKITLSQNSYTYDGNEHKPAVTVTFEGKRLNEGSDYTIAYENCRNIGDAYVTVTGTGSFKGSSKVRYCIDPADLSGYKLGDVNFDRKITVTDVTLTSAQVKAKIFMSESRRRAADINGDGRVNVSDLSLMAAHVKSKKSLPNRNIA